MTKKLFALALLLVCLTAVLLATQAVAPKPAGKCIYTLLNSWLGADGCVHEIYGVTCAGQGYMEIEMKTCT